jgi:regulator of sigma E protease
VTPGGPADKAGVKPGEALVQATLKQPTPEQLRGEKITYEKSIYSSSDFSEESLSWPTFFSKLQYVHPQSTVELTFAKDRKATLATEESGQWYNRRREVVLTPDTVLCKAHSIGQAARLGADDTGESLLLVVKFLRKLTTRKISPKAFGGPGTIAAIAYQTARQGLPKFLLFLTMLSANLAVLNILPIPVLDGGHLMFLTYEGIRGKPANERIQMILSLIGLFFLLALMIFVISLDVWRFLL